MKLYEIQNCYMNRFLSGLFLLLFCTQSVFAQYHADRSALRFRTKTNRPLTVVIDGRHFKRYGTVLTIGDIPPGMHRVKIYYYYPGGNSGGYRTYRAHAELIYQGRIRVAPATMYYCVIDGEYGKMNVRESHMVSLDANEETYPINIHIDEERPEDLSRRYKYEDRDRERERQRAEDKKGRSGDISFNNNEPTTAALTREQMVTLRKSVDEKITDNDKLTLMQQYLRNKSMTTEQVSVMLDWLTFEASRLELAKTCYDKVSDNENYLQIANKFTFQNSKKELEDYMFSR